MSHFIVLDDWITMNEAMPGMPDPAAGGVAVGPPGGMPGAPGGPSVTNPPPADMATPPQNQAGSQPGQQPDISNDPQTPDMPPSHQMGGEGVDFEQWKNLYFKNSIKGDTQQLIDLIHQIRDLDLDTYPRKFVEDNLQVQFLRQNANIDKASKEIRKLLREELDQNNPSRSNFLIDRKSTRLNSSH